MLNIKLDKGISDDLEAYSAFTGLSKTAVVEKALNEYFKNYNDTNNNVLTN